MKIQVICENCGKVAEIKPVHGQNAYINRNLKNNFYIDEINIECSSTDELEDISDFDDISIDTELKELKIQCRGCSDYIVLTEFGQ